MPAYRTPLIAALIAPLTLGACATPPASSTPKPAVLPASQRGFSVRSQFDDVTCYGYDGVCYPSMAALLPAARQALTGKIAATPAPSPIAASIRVVVADCADDQGFQPDDQRARAFRQFTRLQAEMEAELIRQKGVFTSAVVETVTTCLPDSGSFDYVLWHAGSGWKIRARNGLAVGIASRQGETFAPWLKAVAERVAEADKLARERFRLGSEVVSQKSVRFRFNGLDYADSNQVTGAVTREIDFQLQQIKATEPLGGKLMVLLPRASGTKDVVLAAAPLDGPELDIAMARQAYDRILARAKLAALRRAELFDDIAVEVVDSSTFPDRAGADWIIWQSSDDARRWMVRARKGIAVVLPGEMEQDGLTGWLEASTRIMRGLR